MMIKNLITKVTVCPDTVMYLIPARERDSIYVSPKRVNSVWLSEEDFLINTLKGTIREHTRYGFVYIHFDPCKLESSA